MWRSLALVAIASTMSAHAQDPARYLALGDSYTIGEGVAEHDRWPNQLAESLRRSGVAIDSTEIVARTGWTTDELSAAMDAHAFHPPYSLITLLIGVNNQYRGRDVPNYRDEFRALLKRAIELAGGRADHVIVVSIPDWGVTKFGRESGRDTQQIARELDAYNAAAADIATSARVAFVDITSTSRDGGDSAPMLAGDGLHPSAAMYRRWTERIAPAALKALSSH